MSWSRWNCERGGTYPAGASIGVALRLVGGKVKASGPREAVASLLVPLREHRAALADALQARAGGAMA